MFSTSDSWLGIGIVVMIGLAVVGLAACMGKLIIVLFGPAHAAEEASGKDHAAIQSKLHEAV